MYSLNETIIACSTNLSLTSAIGIIRISGKDFFKKLDPYLSLSTDKIKNRYAHFVRILDEEKEVIDEGIILYFKAPNSYTGEDVLEIQTHGNPIILKKIINLFEKKCEFKAAHEGEFTYRALKNKKMSLTQVEGLDLLIHGKNDYVIKEGKSLLGGELNSLYQLLYQLFLNTKSSLEILINFTDDIDETYAREKFNESLKELRKNVEKLYQRVSLNGNKILKPKIVLSGKPNAGKSSFFNRLLSQNRSIVSEVAGTTRDYVSESLFLQGNEFEFIDTAGLRNSNDSIESQGIKLAKDLINGCFYNIHLIDINSFNNLDLEEIEGNEPDLVLVNKYDLVSEKRFAQVIEIISSKFKYLNHSISKDFDENALFQAILIKFQELTKKAPILLERHGQIILDIHNLLNSDSFTEEQAVFDAAIVSSEILLVQDKIESLIGVLSSDLVLDNIFSNYCIGK